MSTMLAEAAGTLESTSFGALLVNALDARVTGTLVLEEPSGVRHGVFFEAGTPARARLAVPEARLGEVLVETGALRPDVYGRTLERALAERVLHGQVLLNEGLITEAALDQGLNEQLTRQVSWLFGQPLATKYGYFAAKNFLLRWGGPWSARPDPLTILWRGLRDHARAADIEAVLASVVGRRIVLKPEVPPEHFACMGRDGMIIEHLRARPQYVTDLIDGASGLEANVKRVVCFLVLTRSMQLRQSSAPPAGLSTPRTDVSIPPPAGVPTFRSLPPNRG